MNIIETEIGKEFLPQERQDDCTGKDFIRNYIEALLRDKTIEGEMIPERKANFESLVEDVREYQSRNGGYLHVLVTEKQGFIEYRKDSIIHTEEDAESDLRFWGRVFSCYPESTIVKSGEQIGILVHGLFAKTVSLA